MKERGILFSAPMVRALLDGRKTQTRCPVKPQPAPHHGLQPMWGTSPDGQPFGECGLWREVGPDYPDGDADDRRCPYGQPGDRLWVRETWAVTAPLDQVRREHEDMCAPLDFNGPYYRATASDFDQTSLRWRPSIHLPRWASRITLELEAVRVERLQDLTEEDAQAEGVTPFAYDPEGDCWTAAAPERKHRTAFEYLWCQLHGWHPNAWEANPWVWVLSFHCVEPAPCP